MFMIVCPWCRVFRLSFNFPLGTPDYGWNCHAYRGALNDIFGEAKALVEKGFEVMIISTLDNQEEMAHFRGVDLEDKDRSVE
jgi:hypothetical protein